MTLIRRPPFPLEKNSTLSPKYFARPGEKPFRVAPLGCDRQGLYTDPQCLKPGMKGFCDD